MFCLLWGIKKFFLWNMSKSALMLAFRLFDNFPNLFPKYFELLSFFKKKFISSVCASVLCMLRPVSMHANILSAHYFYLETCEVWPANIIVFVFLQTSRVFFSVDLFRMSLPCCVCLFLFYIGRA